MMKNHENLS
jgi:hypothetical protein